MGHRYGPAQGDEIVVIIGRSSGTGGDDSDLMPHPGEVSLHVEDVSADPSGIGIIIGGDQSDLHTQSHLKGYHWSG